jgi:hypothetical protein
MSDPSTNPPAPTPGAPTPPSHEQLAGLAPFQNQLAWVGSEQFNRGVQQGAKNLTEKLGMTVEDAVEKLKALDQPGQPTTQPPAGQQGQPSADLERRIADLEKKSSQLDQRETELNERESTIKTKEQDGLRVAALKELGMTDAQATTAMSMLPLPTGVTELTSELAKASAAQLKETFPGLFVAPTPPTGGENGGGQPPAGGPPPDTHTRGTGTQGAAGSGAGVSAEDRAKARLTSRGHVKPTQG